MTGALPPPLLLAGPRGLGKTVLLGEIASRAGEQYGWPTVHVEAQPRGSLIDQLAARLDACRALISDRPTARGLQAQSATLKAGVAGVGGEVLDVAMAALAGAAIERNSGILVTVDETQLADRGEPGAVPQQATGAGGPVVVVFAEAGDNSRPRSVPVSDDDAIPQEFPAGAPRLLTITRLRGETGLSQKALARRIERGTLRAVHDDQPPRGTPAELERAGLLGQGNPGGALVVWRELYELEREQQTERARQLEHELTALAYASPIRAIRLRRQARRKLSEVTASGTSFAADSEAPEPEDS